MANDSIEDIGAGCMLQIIKFTILLPFFLLGLLLKEIFSNGNDSK